jgi:MFS family permease
LIGDYYAGTRRERFLAAQTGTSPVIATIIAVAGGALGEASWRYPYFIYAFAFILIPFVGFFLTEPVRETESVQAESDSIERKNSTFTISGFFHDWGKLTGICLLTVFSLSAFLLVIIQLPFLLTERGVDSPAVIGKWISIVNMCIAVGALLYTIVPWKTLAKLAASYLLFCSGFLIMGLSSTWIPAVVGAIIASIGAGIILPNLISWALRTLPLEKRGKGTGAWQASSFLGQFLSPLIVLGLKKATGSLSMAVTIYGVACGILMIATLYSAIKGRYQMSKEIASEIS